MPQTDPGEHRMKTTDPSDKTAEPQTLGGIIDRWLDDARRDAVRFRSVYECSALCGFQSDRAPPIERCTHCDWSGSDAGEFCPECDHQAFIAVCPKCGEDAVCDHPDTTPVTGTFYDD